MNVPVPPSLSYVVDLVPLSLLGGVLGLDVVSFPQVMVSRPVVAATLGGAFAGNAVAGLVCGAVLECLAVESLPVGASRYPEWGSASTVAGVLAAQGASESAVANAGSLVIAVMVGIVTAWIGGWTMVQHRRTIAHWARPRLELLASGSARTVIALQLFGMTLDLVRGAVLTFAMLVPALSFTRWADARWNVSAEVTKATVVTTVAAVAAAAIWKDFHAIPGTRRLFLAALAVGTVAAMLHA